MRLHAALEHISARRYRTLEPWEKNTADHLARFIEARSPETIEFSFDYLDPDQAGDTLETFISFANDLWDAGIAPIPHDFFWVSWSQKVMDMTVHMAAFCEKVVGQDGAMTALSVKVIFENKRRDGLAFVNDAGLLVVDDHKVVLIGGANSDTGGLFVENGFATVKALIGALATPQAIRTEEPAPAKLNKARLAKGKPPISTVIKIDVRASRQAAAQRKSEGGWSVKPHWRRGHLRHLANGKIVPIPPCCVNMEDGVPVKPEYVVRV